MRNFFARVDRLVDRMIDTDSFIPAKGRIRPVQIKVIFDNLRYYPLLAFLWVGVSILQKDQLLISSLGGVTLAGFVLIFGLLVVLQTWMIALIMFVSTIGALLPPRWAVAFRRHVRANHNWAKATVLLLISPVLLAAWALVVALLGALSRAGVI